ncbi:hypothetical protein DSM112329_02844 [Paraconexibacter sp. AEG42_29]|uniref:DUF7878 domain-containing protein n=1 Tax=Paraconexibacter sp. AEG42_29 TaxID=2997339 RepID=A0AAU7AWI1_9ACTN
MLLTYDRLDVSELRGTSVADYLVSVQADFRVVDNDRCVFEELAFPVVELARALLQWVNDPQRVDFEFDSMSFEERGAVRVRSSARGWILGTVFEAADACTPADWPDVERSIRAFTAKVAADLSAPR